MFCVRSNWLFPVELVGMGDSSREIELIADLENEISMHDFPSFPLQSDE